MEGGTQSIIKEEEADHRTWHNMAALHTDSLNRSIAHPNNTAQAQSIPGIESRDSI